MDVYGLDLNTFHPQNIGGLAPWVEAHPNSSETSCSCQSWSANQHRKAYGTGPQKTHYSGTHLWKFYGMWTSFRQLSSSPLASSNPCTRRITGLAKSARLSAPLRCTLSEIDSESLACRWAHLAVNTRAKSQKSQKSQIPTISNTCWNRAISWSWKHSTCLNQTCQGHARQNQDMAEHPHRFKPTLSSTEAQNRRYFENPWNTLKFT